MNQTDNLPPDMSQLEFARLVGRSAPTIHRLVKIGKLPLNAERRIPTAEGLAAFKGKVSVYRTRNGMKGGIPGVNPRAKKPAEVAADDAPSGETYVEAERRLMIARADKAESDNEHANLDWIRVTDATPVIDRYLSTLRARLINIAGAAAREANADAPHVAQAAFQRHLAEAMAGISAEAVCAEVQRMRVAERQKRSARTRT